MAIEKVSDDVVNETGVIRFRWIGIVLGGLAALFLTFISDPDTLVLFQIPMGSSVVILLKALAYFALAAAVMHIGCKTMFDYINRLRLIEEAISQKQAGSVFIGLAIFMLAFAWVFSALIGMQ